MNKRSSNLPTEIELFLGDVNAFDAKVVGPFQSNLLNASQSVVGEDRSHNIFFKTNSYNYRCDEFVQEHLGNHILFSGCSVTHGIGLEEDELWSKKIYNKIKKEKEVSGYFNLAVYGMSTLEIIINIYKYINSFGKPNYIFLNIPDSYRFYLHDTENNELVYANFISTKRRTEYDLPKILPLLSYHYLLMLESYCRTNNIFLSYVDWSLDTNLHYSDLQNLQRYFSADVDNYLIEHFDKYKNNQYASKARDGVHHGVAFHDFWTEVLYNDYRKHEDRVNGN